MRKSWNNLLTHLKYQLHSNTFVIVAVMYWVNYILIETVEKLKITLSKLRWWKKYSYFTAIQVAISQCKNAPPQVIRSKSSLSTEVLPVSFVLSYIIFINYCYRYMGLVVGGGGADLSHISLFYNSALYFIN